MSLMSRSHAPSTATTCGRWREWNLVALVGLHAYSMAIGWQAQAVSYPLYRAVGADDFSGYHAAYNDSIPLVVIAPGFLTFLGAIVFVWSRPTGVPRWIAGLVSGAGAVSLLTTILWAIPRHDQLDRIGQSAATIDDLLAANSVRVTALTVGTVAVSLCAARLLRQSTSRCEDGSAAHIRALSTESS